MANWFIKISNIIQNKSQTDVYLISIYNKLQKLKQQTENVIYSYQYIIDNDEPKYIKRRKERINVYKDFIKNIKNIFILYNNINKQDLINNIKKPDPYIGGIISKNITEIFEDIKNIIDKIEDVYNNELFDKYGIMNFHIAKFISDLVQNIIPYIDFVIYRIQKDYIEPHNLTNYYIIQEFEQYKENNEPIYKSVQENDTPLKGYAWKKQNEEGNWEYWKINWDTSD